MWGPTVISTAYIYGVYMKVHEQKGRMEERCMELLTFREDVPIESLKPGV